MSEFEIKQNISFCKQEQPQTARVALCRRYNIVVESLFTRAFVRLQDRVVETQDPWSFSSRQHRCLSGRNFDFWSFRSLYSDFCGCTWERGVWGRSEGTIAQRAEALLI
uniref:Uncharacterized protein n=1 Tax=Knipowitschia caucasica TaxID=637954 RepID=A0AAV2LT22_KNICA